MSSSRGLQPKRKKVSFSDTETQPFVGPPKMHGQQQSSLTPPRSILMGPKRRDNDNDNEELNHPRDDSNVPPVEQSQPQQTPPLPVSSVAPLPPNDPSQPATIVIIGGGIVGLVLALRLQTQLGITAEIYEGNVSAVSSSSSGGAGLGLYPNGLRVLRDISPTLLQGVRGAGFPYQRRNWKRHDGTCILSAEEEFLMNHGNHQEEDNDGDLDDMADHGDLEPMGIRRCKLQMVLYSYARRHGIQVHTRKTLVQAVEHDENNEDSINGDNDGLIELTFADGTTRWTRILFGADGVNSQVQSIVRNAAISKELATKDKVADALVLDEEEEYSSVTCLMGLSKCPSRGLSFPSFSSRQKHDNTQQEGFHAVFFPTGQNETCFQFHMPVRPMHSTTAVTTLQSSSSFFSWGKNMSSEIGRAECQQLAQQLRAQGWHEQYVRHLEHVTEAVRVSFDFHDIPKKHQQPQRWVKGRMCLVGDAAHPPVPYLGQGAQQGMEDAGVAVSLLKIYCLTDQGEFDPTNFEKAMTLYQEIRSQRSDQLREFSKSLLGRKQYRQYIKQNKHQLDQHRQKRRASNESTTSCSSYGDSTEDSKLMAEYVLKGEVLMYGTLPIMWPGATHDYKKDVQRVTEQINLPQVNQEDAVDALKRLFGFEPPVTMTTMKKAAGSNLLTSELPHYLPVDYKASHDDRRALVDWLVEGLELHLKRIVAHNARFPKPELLSPSEPSWNEEAVVESWNQQAVIDQLQEVLPAPNRSRMRRMSTTMAETTTLDPSRVTLPRKVTNQLQHFVKAVTQLYHDENPFHNFEHACNVTMGVSQFLTRMVAERGATLTMQDRTFGIVSDPLTQFSVVFAALVHDADHAGVPNAQLVKEDPELSKAYKHKAVAEQRSVDVAFALLMKPEYRDLRLTIYRDQEEMNRFRQLVVNAVMATDICDKDLKESRNKRWEKAFPAEGNSAKPTLETHPRKFQGLRATIGIELLMQASDILHTMQSWKSYKQWNERLFAEMYKAYREGRSNTDPSTFWFKGEIGFFDFYIIPLAERLQMCGAFGTMGDECLSYAKSNRQEWLLKGPGAINEMIRKVTLQISQPAACTA